MERAAETVKRAIQGYVARKRYEAMKRTLSEDASEDIHHSDDLSVIPEEDSQMSPRSNGSVPLTECEVVAIADGGTDEHNEDAENEASELDTDDDLEDM
ncbi:hypothetical protein NP493_411g02095 [Ridgeia piscesae]|uniref:Uncharacterized protein n=1 Tax=Ridgeia piscesae TaxID=27915 RepID=A0AAD9L170_RIDPI|nr:hypothetical protein NP493_411g02095 [Ridgeia piscesae]